MPVIRGRVGGLARCRPEHTVDLLKMNGHGDVAAVTDWLGREFSPVEVTTRA